MPKPIVLICDDNPAIAASLNGYLTAENMEVLTAETGEDAIRTINARKVNLLILDIILP